MLVSLSRTIAASLNICLSRCLPLHCAGCGASAVTYWKVGTGQEDHPPDQVGRRQDAKKRCLVTCRFAGVLRTELWILEAAPLGAGMNFSSGDEKSINVSCDKLCRMCMYVRVIYVCVYTFVQVNAEDRSSFSVTGHLSFKKQGLTEP